MFEKLYLRDLDCYRKATDKQKAHKLFCPDRFFDLSRFGDKEIAAQLYKFITTRGQLLSPLSIRSDLFPFNQLCDFLNEDWPQLNSFTDTTISDMTKKAKVWLLKKGKNLSQQRIRITTGKPEISDHDLIKYIRKIYSYLTPTDKTFDRDSDRWYLRDAPINIRYNPVKAVDSITFEKIPQPRIRTEIKDVIYIHLSQYAIGTIQAEMSSINRFAGYLAERYPEVNTLTVIDRELMEQYLLYTNTEATGRKSYTKELCHLKTVLITAGKILDIRELEHLFFIDDKGTATDRLYKVYSSSELERLNAAIVKGDPQVARALILHQLLGTRISGTLTIKQDAIFKNQSDQLFVRLQQIKTQKTCVKPINDEIKRLIDKAREYTNDRYGDREYIFVDDENPDRPMQYGKIQYHLMAMIHKYDLRDDHGRLFTVGTHTWRHNYGKRLTELHIDDKTIAELMGHSNTSSLKYYRKVGNKMLADETRTMRDSMDKILEDYLFGEAQS